MKLTILDYSTGTTYIYDFKETPNEDLDDVVKALGFKLSDVEYMLTKKLEISISHG